MENKYQSNFGGRVGGGFRYATNATQPPPPYRDHNISKIISVTCGLDTSREGRAGLLDQRSIL